MEHAYPKTIFTVYLKFKVNKCLLFYLATPVLAPDKASLPISTHLYSLHPLQLGQAHGWLKLTECDRSDTLPVSGLDLEETWQFLLLFCGLWVLGHHIRNPATPIRLHGS